MKKIILMFILLAFNANILLAQSNFGPKILLDSTLNCNDIESIDINNDGLQDLIFSENLFFGQTKRISKSMNLGNGDMSELTTIIPMNSTRSFIAKGDFNNDGWLDLVSYESSLTTEDTGELFILRNNTDDTFTRITLATNLNLGQEIQVADMNNDGLEDIILAEDPRLSVFFNQSNLVFTQEIISNPNPTEHYTIEIADLHNDGYPEIIEGAFPLYIYDNTNATIQFDATASNIPTTTSAIFAISVGDLDNDGFIDILTENGSQNELLWFKNLNGTFSAKHVIDSNVAVISDIDVKDIDNDGKLDIMTAYNQSGEIVWYKNNGGGSFSTKKVIHTGTIPRPNQVHLVDLNNDSFQDAVWSNELAYHLNQQNLGTDNSISNTIFQLYPNPSKQNFTIQVNEAASYEIYDQSGRIVTKSIPLHEGENFIQHSLSSGIYYVKIESEKQEEIIKLLVN